MENRIRVVWLLSLVSALLVIGVQGYWLYNQYTLVVDAYSRELSTGILEAGEEEYLIRLSKAKPVYKYLARMQSVYDIGDSVQTSVSRTLRLLMDRQDLSPDFFREREESGDADTTRYMSLHFSWDKNFSEEELQAGLSRIITDHLSPYRQELLDSLLTVALPDLRYTAVPWEEADSSVRYLSHRESCGSLFSPRIAVYYAHNPLKRCGVVIEAAVPVQPVFRRMAVQWALALGLIMLLTACFVFQIKTILKQKRLGDMREHFVNATIHELRRPVQTLKTFVAFLGDREMRVDEDATERVVQDAMFELDNLSAYLNKLRDMLRAGSESTTLNRVAFDLPALIEKVVRLTYIPDGKTVRLHTACDMGDSAQAEGDPVHIANVLNNLVENAVKYSGREVDIEVTAVRGAKGIVMTVTDNGTGIHPSEQIRVFDMFYRGAGLPARDIPGLGLGLSYVKLIARAHQGDVGLRSHPGRGTIITFFIPQ